MESYTFFVKIRSQLKKIVQFYGIIGKNKKILRESLCMEVKAVIYFRKNLVLLIILTVVFSQIPFYTPTVFGESNSIVIENVEVPQNGSAQEIIESTYPLNNQTQVEVKPTIKIVFKYPVGINDKSKITLDSGGEEYILDSDEIYLLQDERTLCIDIGRIGKLPLRRSTLYHLTLSNGAIKLKGYDITNEDITISFITRSEGQSPKIIGHSSYASGGDDITSLSATRLSREGFIHIRFDRNIKLEKNTDKQKLLEGTKLYRIPKPTETDEVGNDKAFEFEPGITEAHLKGEAYRQEIDVEDIEIINNNTLRIKPKWPLLSLNQYRLTIKKELIEDVDGYSLENDVDFYFWTAPAPEKPQFNWEHVEGTLPGSIKDNPSTGGKSCTIVGTSAYGPDNPLVFLIEGEAISKAGDISSLKRITLVEGYEPENTIKISKVRFEYYIEGGVKKTRLLIYPENTLDAGKYYVLTVPGVIQNRSGQFLPRLDIYFTVGGNAEKPAGICKIEPNTFELIDIYKGTAAFTIKGYNFDEGIEYISLELVSGENAGTVQTAVYKKDIEFKSITQLDVKLRDPKVISELLAGGGGEYLVKLFFKNRLPVSNESVTFKILPRGKPKVIATDPPGGNTWSNEKRLNAITIDGTTRYFLKITFDDFDGSLRFDTDLGLNLLQTSSVFSEGQNEVSMIDTEFITFIQNIEDSELKNSYISQYIFVKDGQAGQAYLYVPVKPLRSQTTYVVMINAGIIYFSGDSSSQNDPIQWTFTTTANPVVSSTEVGSVIEDYDEDEPIILYGDFFDEQNIEIYFNDIRARRVRLGIDENGQKLLRVYLPSGRNRLEPGIYTIRVRNDRDHEFEVFGALSVVEEGSHIPNEEYRVKDELRIGEVISSLSISEDTLILDRRYTDRRSVEVNLDEIMGQEVLTRKIRFDGRRGDRISTLETLSKWADITLYDIGIDDYRSDEEADIILGRAEPQVAQNLKQKLGRQKIKSEFIQVTGQNVRFSSFTITMPFKESDGYNLKVLSYDPDTRQFNEQDFSVDQIEKTATIRSYSPGIFVVVEK